nr:alpha-ketoglutarate-dependent dioxygenase AlkB [Kitasatospora sp. MMS16-BH015]
MFAGLSDSAALEPTGKGRRGAVLTRADAAGHVPLVRTTTRYAAPPQHFRPVHRHLADRIAERAGLPAELDNALFETYTNAYTTMGAHSDQALDLAEGSSIAVFSCYRHPDAGPPRKLLFEAKTTGEKFELPLLQGSVVTFTLEANRRFRHRIVLDKAPEAADNEWLGLTFRTAGTRLRFTDGTPRLPDGARLTPAEEEQQREFYALRRRENTETDFAYPHLGYTLSASDLVPPV